MPKGSDNPFPSLLVVEQGSTPSTPSSGDQRLFVRTSDHVLCYVNSSGTVTPVGAGLANPMTTKGDIILGDTGGTPSRLAAGTSTYVLTSNGAAAFPSWQVSGGGGGGGAQALPIDAAAAASVGSGDLFSGTSLDGGWSSLQSTAVTSVDRSNANWCKILNTGNTGGKDRGLQRAFAPSGDFTVYGKIGSVRSDAQYIWAGIFIGAADPSDGGSGHRLETHIYSGAGGASGWKFTKIDAGSESAVWDHPPNDFGIGYGATNASGNPPGLQSHPHWFRIRRSGSTLYCGGSSDGVYWWEDATTTTISFTVATIGIYISEASASGNIWASFNYIATTG